MSVSLRSGFRPGRPSLVAYVMAGYPDRPASLEALRALVRGGADVIELGVPYADPLADGPVIRDAATEAMSANEGGFGLAETLDLAAEFLAEPGTGPDGAAPPLAVMTYLNPMMRIGFASVAQRASDASVSGFIVPDMPPDNPMTALWLQESGPRGLETVFLVAPTSTKDRIRTVAEAARGFVYVVSSLGVTGERGQLPPQLGELVRRVKDAQPEAPLAVGFGVGTPEQAREVARLGADGVVVGSAIVRRQREVRELEEFVSELAEAVHSA